MSPADYKRELDKKNTPNNEGIATHKQRRGGLSGLQKLIECPLSQICKLKGTI
jgi:hypothetical protein